MEDYCPFTALLEHSFGAIIYVKVMSTTIWLVMLVNITKILVKGQAKFLLDYPLIKVIVDLIGPLERSKLEAKTLWLSHWPSLTSTQWVMKSYKWRRLLANKLHCISKIVCLQGIEDLSESFMIKELNSWPLLVKLHWFAMVLNQCQLPSSIRRQMQSGCKGFDATIKSHL